MEELGFGGGKGMGKLDVEFLKKGGRGAVI